MSAPSKNTNLAAPAVDPSQEVSAYRWVIAFAALGLLLWAFSLLRIGYTILYYLAVLVLFTMVLTQYQAIAWLLAPFSVNTNPLTKPSGQIV